VTSPIFRSASMQEVVRTLNASPQRRHRAHHRRERHGKSHLRPPPRAQSAQQKQNHQNQLRRLPRELIESELFGSVKGAFTARTPTAKGFSASRKAHAAAR